MAVIKVVKYDGPPDVFAWKHPSRELGTWTQLIVNESQEAILFKEGRALDLFGPGRHTLDTDNIPLLKHLVNLPFGGRSPFTAEIWYVNKAHNLDVKWGTFDPIQVMDPKFQIAVPVRSFGQFTIQISDARKFLVKLVGTQALLTKEQIENSFKGLLLTHAKDAIAGSLVNEGVSVLEINARLAELSSFVQEKIAGVFDEYGVKLVHFFVNSINVPESDPAYGKLRSALADRAEMSIKGFTYQEQRSFDALQAAASNEGAGGMGNLGVGLGVGFGVGGAVGGAFGQMAGHLQTGPGPGSPPAGATNCAKCGVLLAPNAKFCAGCGTPVAVPGMTACPHCSTAIPADARFCPSCGKPARISCANCGTALTPGARFCPECATPVSPTQQGGAS